MLVVYIQQFLEGQEVEDMDVFIELEEENYNEQPIRLQLEGTVGFLKIVDTTNNRIVNCSGIIIDETTVLTIAQNVYNNCSSSFYPQIQFITGNNFQTYHVTEASLINPACSQNSFEQGGIIEYAILKLDRKIEENSSMSNIFYKRWISKQDNHVSQMQQKCSLLEESLKRTNLRIRELSEQLKQIRFEVKKRAKQSYQNGKSLINNRCLEDAWHELNVCLKLQQCLYGKEGLEIIKTLKLLAISYREINQQEIFEYYEQILKICEKHKTFGKDYAQALFGLGQHWHIYQDSNDAIYYFEQALHINSQINCSEGQIQCAEKIMEIFWESNRHEAAQKIKQKYGLFYQ